MVVDLDAGQVRTLPSSRFDSLHLVSPRLALPSILSFHSLCVSADYLLFCFPLSPSGFSQRDRRA